MKRPPGCIKRRGGFKPPLPTIPTIPTGKIAHLSFLDHEEDIAIVVLVATIHIRLKFQEVQQLGNLGTIEATWLASDLKKPQSGMEIYPIALRFMRYA